MGTQLEQAEANSKKHHKKMLDAARESIQMSNEAIQVSAKSIAAITLAEIIAVRQAEMEALVERRLSLSRAESVAEFLSSEGVDPGRLEAVGLGSQFPVADNSTAQGRKQNRRVEILVSP